MIGLELYNLCNHGVSRSSRVAERYTRRCSRKNTLRSIVDVVLVVAVCVILVLALLFHDDSHGYYKSVTNSDDGIHYEWVAE